ncbi:hypothetical protein DASC09_011410 [Saccharomycopsis crataegensis]|uniref:F-box domain-containing protein n=1 Tax=Saccharomycopsis crataegensis TaxID=43959 RepID=A0AAV5QGH1_9ASCO|nr:hypothetical protein DASC09_011410 [Saccharomycopsis crataegensis]
MLQPSILPAIAHQFSYTSKINHDLLNLSNTCTRLRIIVGRLVFGFVSLVRYNEWQSNRMVRNGKIAKKMGDKLILGHWHQGESFHSLLKNPIDLSIGTWTTSFFPQIEFLECTIDQYLFIPALALQNLKSVKLFNIPSLTKTKAELSELLPKVSCEEYDISKKIGIEYLCIPLDCEPDMVSKLLKTMRFDRLDRLDMLLDYSNIVVGCNGNKNLEMIRSQYLYDTRQSLSSAAKKKSDTMAGIKEINIVSKGFSLMPLSCRVMKFITSMGSESLQRLVFRTADGGSLHPGHSNSSANQAEIIGDYGVKFFEEMLYTLPKMRKLTMELDVIKGFGYTNRESILGIRDAFLRKKVNEPSELFTFELIYGSTLVVPMMALMHQKNSNPIIELLKSLPSQNLKLIFNYQKQIESVFQIAQLVMLDLIHNLELSQLEDLERKRKDDGIVVAEKRPFFTRISQLQLNWAWSTVDSYILASHDSKMSEYAEHQGRTYPIKVPRYGRVGDCSPDFRIFELYEIEYTEPISSINTEACFENTRSRMERRVLQEYSGNDSVASLKAISNVQPAPTPTGRSLVKHVYDMKVHEMQAMIRLGIKQDREFWSNELAKLDLEEYSKPTVLSALWD